MNYATGEVMRTGLPPEKKRINPDQENQSAAIHDDLFQFCLN